MSQIVSNVLSTIHIWLFRGQAQLSNHFTLAAKQNTLLGAGEGDRNDTSNVTFNDNGAAGNSLSWQG